MPPSSTKDRPDRRRSVALLALAVLACGMLVASPPPSASPEGVVLVVAATAAGLLLLREERLGRGPTLRMVVVAVALAGAVAVSFPPRGSNDVWSYVMYGRTAAVHHASPYTHVPADYPRDPFLARTGQRWRHTPSVYGPVFVAYSSVGAWLAGGSAVLARLFHQLLALAALATAMYLVWGRTRSPAGLALLGLAPAVMVATVNGGHNDLLVGVLILAGVLAALSERPALAGAVIGVAAGIKITAGLAALGLAIWYVRRRSWHAAIRSVVATVGVVGLLYLAAGPSAVTALGANRNLMSRASAWQLPRHLLGLDTHRQVLLGWDRAEVVGTVATVATVFAVLVGVALSWRRSSRSGPEDGVAVATAGYQVGGAYVLPWYAAWALPTAMLRPHSRMTQLLAIHAGFLAAAYSLPRGLPPLAWLPDERFLVEYAVPLLALAAFVAVGSVPRRRVAVRG